MIQENDEPIGDAAWLEANGWERNGAWWFRGPLRLSFGYGTSKDGWRLESREHDGHWFVKTRGELLSLV